MPKIDISMSKTLKLTNVMIIGFDIMKQEALESIDIEMQKLDNYIRVKSAKTVGPLIQHSMANVDEKGDLSITMEMMIQCDKFIHSMEPPYRMKSVIRVPNCMYCRYIGSETSLKFAYEKIQVTAFEEDIPLEGDSYTIYIDRNEDDIITADIFMERAD